MHTPENNEVREPDLEGVEMKMPENATPLESAPPHKSMSVVIIVLLFLILLLILGGLYYWATFMNQPATEILDPMQPTNEQEFAPAVQADEFGTVSTSNELDAIEADIESTNFDDLDTELTAIDVELEAAMEAQ